MDLSNLQNHYEELLNYMALHQYSETYIYRFRKEIQHILNKANDNTWISYQDIYHVYEKTPHSSHYLRNKRTIIGALEQFDKNRLFPDGRRRHSLIERSSYHLLSSEFKVLIDFYIESERKRGKKESTIMGESQNTTTFLLHLQQKGHKSLNTILEDDVISFFISGSGERIRSCSYRKNISAIFKTGQDWNKQECHRVLSFLPMLRENRKNIQYLTVEEVAVIRECARNGELSFRNTAIVFLLLYTGLRGCDISGLRLDAIDWSQETIRINQQKTNEPLELPLLPVVGNAIYDYLRLERPDINDPHVFLTETKHYSLLASGSIGSIVAKILKISGIRQNKGDRKGTHIFRHHLASKLLENGVSRPVISQTLGHTTPNSLEPYLRADFVHLKECAISVADFPVSEGVFNR